MTDTVVSVGVENDIIVNADEPRRLDGVRARVDDLLSRSRRFGRPGAFETRFRQADFETRDRWWRRHADGQQTNVTDMLVARYGSVDNLRDAANVGDPTAVTAHKHWVDATVAGARLRGEDPLSSHYFSTPSTMKRLEMLDRAVVSKVLDQAFDNRRGAAHPKFILFDSTVTSHAELSGTRDWLRTIGRNDAVVVLDRQGMVDSLGDAGMAERPRPLTARESESLIVDELAILSTRACAQAFPRGAHVVLDTSIPSILHDPGLVAASAADNGYAVHLVEMTARGPRLTEVRAGHIALPLSTEERASLTLAREVATLRYGAGGEGGLNNLFTEIDGLRDRMVRLERVARILGEFARNRRGRGAAALSAMSTGTPPSPIVAAATAL